MDGLTETYANEIHVLRSKLHAKCEALKILTKELNKCREERDQLALMTEQIKCKPDQTTSRVEQLLNDTCNENKLLKLELERMKMRLMDGKKDVEVLRKQLVVNQTKNDGRNDVDNVELIEQLEMVNAKTIQMRADLQSMLDEKEELIKERDAFKHKAHRLNHELSVVLQLTKPGDDACAVMDIDALISENRFLHDRVKQLEAEQELAAQSLAKYKSIVETKKRKGSVKLGTKNTELIVSHKQVRELLENGSVKELPVTAATINDLKSLCFELLDGLSDKTLALVHQKKANKILASRLTELETRLQQLLGDDRVSTFPSVLILDNYNSADADKLEVPLDEGNDAKKSTVNKVTYDEECASDGTDTLSLPPRLKSMLDKALCELRRKETDIGRL